MGLGWSLGFAPYNEWWKNSRRLFHKHFQLSTVSQFRPKQTKATHGFLQRLLDSPERFREHMQLCVPALILGWAIKFTYCLWWVGWPVAQLLTLHMGSISAIRTTLTSSGQKSACKLSSRLAILARTLWISYLHVRLTIPSLLVFFNLLSLVKHVPEWMPGASFKRKAREWRRAAERVYTIPFDYVKQTMEDGTAKPSFTSLALRDITEDDDRDYQEELIKALGGTMYTGMWAGCRCEPSDVASISWSRYGTDHTRTVNSTHRNVLVDRLDPPDFLPRDADEPSRTRPGPRRD